MNHGGRRLLAALLLAAAAVSVPAKANAADGEPLDLEKTVALTILPGPAGFLPDLQPDEGEAPAAVDVYRIAAAVKDPEGKSPFVFEAVKPEIDPALGTYGALAAADWPALAQSMAKAVLMNGSEVLDVPALTPETDLTALDAGLYLMIAHTRGAEPAEYVTLDETGKLSTLVESDMFEYTYSPELIVLPSTAGDNPVLDEHGEPQEITTAGNRWFYAIQARLKPEREERLGSLFIRKQLKRWENSTPVTFVFHVTAVAGEGAEARTVYDNVVSLTFGGATTLTYKILKKIPVGARVTVTEIYSGVRYEIVGEAEKETVIPVPFITGEDGTLVDNQAEVSFVNDYIDGKLLSGYGIENTFTYDGEGIWDGGQNTSAEG